MDFLIDFYLGRNDLWALGCTLYQMLSGSSPFKDASEWLIFQRIIARDLRIPEYFSDEARDLIDKLLVCNYKNDFIVWFLFWGMIYTC
jgi:serine/threonine protein kinase